MTATQPPARPGRSGEPHQSSRLSSANEGGTGKRSFYGLGGASTYTCDAALAAQFTPLRPELGRYEVCTTDRPLEGPAEALEALDAFGAAGSYDRAALQQLYGGARVRVQRSWSATPGEFISITRLSPYPDASLTHLMPGTMEIRFTIRR